ncbi:hypothetical protein ABPG77_009157 [Micractinium sp. CCAP 211/92]
MKSTTALLVGFTLLGVLGTALAGPAPGLQPGRKLIRLVGRGISNIALKLGSDNKLPCAIWQLAAVKPTGPNQNLVGVPVTIKSACRMAPNPTCNAFLTGPTTCFDDYTNMGAGGQWVIEAVGAKYRLRSLARSSCPGQYLGAAKVANQSECGKPPRLGFRAPGGAGASYLDQWIIEDAPTPRSPPPPKKSPPPPSPPAPPPPLQQPRWLPAGTGSRNITTGRPYQISPGYDEWNLGPLFAVSDSITQTGAVYYSTEETVCAQQGGGRRLLRSSTSCRRRRRLSGAGGWIKYLGQDFGNTNGSVSMQVSVLTGRPGVAYCNLAGQGIFKVSNGTDWNYGCTVDGKQLAGSLVKLPLLLPVAKMLPFVITGDNSNRPVVKYCNAGQWETFNGTVFGNPVSDVSLGLWPWDEGNSTDKWIPAVAFIDTNTSLPVGRYYNRTTNNWVTVNPLTTQGDISNLQVRFNNMMGIPLVAFTDKGLGYKGSLEVHVLSRRRQLLSVSSAASAASNDYNVSWTYVPSSSPNVTAGAASDFDVS